MSYYHTYKRYPEALDRNKRIQFYQKLGYTEAQSVRLADHVFDATYQYNTPRSNVSPTAYGWSSVAPMSDDDDDDFDDSDMLDGIAGIFSQRSAPTAPPPQPSVPPPPMPKASPKSAPSLFSRAASAVGGLFGGSSSHSSFASFAPSDSFAAYDMDMESSAPSAPASPMPAAASFRRASMSAAMMGGSPPFMPNTAETHAGVEADTSQTMEESAAHFSANVSSASWSYIRNTVNVGRRIDSSFVRVEEVVNSARYQLPVVGGDTVFDVTAATGDCPWLSDKHLLMVGLNGKGTPPHTRQNLVFLVDVSGSMTDEWELVQMSIMSIIARLGKEDTFSIITYSGHTQSVVQDVSCGNKDQCIDAVLKIHADGGYTAGSDALEAAYTHLAKNFDKNASNRILIFTDGDFNFGITGDTALADFIYTRRLSGIYLSVVGYGLQNFHDNNMEALSRNGNGNYYFIGCPDDAREYLYDKFISLTHTIAKDVKLRLELNPVFVESFRQIGYEVRKLTEQEFNDDRKAVDSIGEGHHMIAVFEIRPASDTPVSKQGRYVQVVSKENQDECGFVTVKYKLPDDSSQELNVPLPANVLDVQDTPDTRLAAFLAAWALYLRDTDHPGDLSSALLQQMKAALMKNGEGTPYLDIFDKTVR